ncbi:hypothetical protein BKA93DRAFT_20766 [Sparassis latifolia]
MEPANCPNCATDSPSSSEGRDYDRTMNFGVVMGVLGGMALVMLFVLIAVPLARCRRRRTGVSTREDVETSFLTSRRSSFRNQKMPSGPDAFLPLIDPVSTFTWSDLHTKNLRTDSMDQAATYSFPTDKAPTSHKSRGRRSSSVEDEMAEHTEDRACPSHTVTPAVRSPTPPGLPSKIDANTAAGRRSPSSVCPLSTDAGGAIPPMLPLSPVSPASTTPVRSSSRSRWAAQKPGMDPVIEDSGDVSTPSRRLPSPPTSPDQTQPKWKSGRRASLTSTSSTPTTLPFRPRSGTGPSLPLTSAFKTSVRSSASQRSDTHRYASTSTSPYPPPRSRPSSVSMEVTQQTAPEVPRPVDEFRRLSTTDIRHRHPPERSISPGSMHSSRAFVRSSEAGSSRFSAHTRGASLSSLAPFSPSPLNSAIPPPHIPYSTTGRRSQPPSVVWKQQLPQPQPQPQQPALVKRRDSLALRPLPPSAFIASPPNSPPRAPSTRSRSNSVKTEHSLPSRLPPFDPLPPLQFDRKFQPEDREGVERESVSSHREHAP